MTNALPVILCLAAMPLSIAGAESMKITVTIDRGRDLGQGFGSLFEGVSEDGSLVFGAGFQNAYNTLLRLLDVAQERYGRVIVAIDDLDKKEPRAMQDLLDDATDLLRRGQGKRGFLLTGRFTSTLQDTSGQILGLFSETISLDRMSTDELHHIAVNYQDA